MLTLIPSIARKVRGWGKAGNRFAFWIMRGRCSVCGVAVPGWTEGEFYACDAHLEQVRERWITAVAYEAATAQEPSKCK